MLIMKKNGKVTGLEEMNMNIKDDENTVVASVGLYRFKPTNVLTAFIDNRELMKQYTDYELVGTKEVVLQVGVFE